MAAPCRQIDFQGQTVPHPTDEGGASVSERVALVARHRERGQLVEEGLQQRLQPGGRRVRGVEQVEDLRAGRTQVAHCRSEDRQSGRAKPLEAQ